MAPDRLAQTTGAVDRASWLDGIGLFSHDTPLANDAGLDFLGMRIRNPRSPLMASSVVSTPDFALAACEPPRAERFKSAGVRCRGTRAGASRYASG
jgi:hypothetical protein